MRRALIILSSAVIALAADRPVPPPGIAIPASDRIDLENTLGQLDDIIEDDLEDDPLLPDVLIFTEAVRTALRHDAFYKIDEVTKARELLRMARSRIDLLLEGKAPWTTATGLVVRGYVSKIDRSVQPYGLVIPESPARPWRLDTWFHGRGETLTEVNFLWDRTRNRGEFTPSNAIVLHLYGRYCNANKFAGEVDLFEAINDVKRHYPIDENRISVRGFSMGGAATWHIGAHHAGEWAAVAPGAGFAETPEYTGAYRDPANKPEWWEEKLYHLYNATDYAANLFNTSVVAYSGEIDKQKQAADIMARALEPEGIRLTHIIGPNTAHKYEPGAKAEVSRRVDAIAARGRDPYPRSVRLVTWSLRYNRMKWLVADALDHHWERARIDARMADERSVTVKTENVAGFGIEMASGGCPLEAAAKVRVLIDNDTVEAPGPMSDRSWNIHFAKQNGHWTIATAGAGLAKRHGLQGPIDDAFMDSFVFVTPTGTPMSPAVGAWVASESQRAVREWRRQFRGDAQLRTDATLKDTDIANSNLVLWGDPSSNRVLARIIDKLPIQWTAGGLSIAGQRFDAKTHAPILVFPNPLNPSRYVVLNSGFTFREGDYLTNARQIPRLPDYAVVDTTTPPDGKWPGRIALAGFFNEQWAIDSKPPITARNSK